VLTLAHIHRIGTGLELDGLVALAATEHLDSSTSTSVSVSGKGNGVLKKPDNNNTKVKVKAVVAGPGEDMDLDRHSIFGSVSGVSLPIDLCINCGETFGADVTGTNLLEVFTFYIPSSTYVLIFSAEYDKFLI
jgi:hypothetical protein